MRKILLLGGCCLLASCVSHYCTDCNCNQETYEYVEPQEVIEEINYNCPVSQPQIIETDPCKCSYVPDNSREILRPRIVEKLDVEPKLRNCPQDGQVLNCGNGNCATFSKIEEVKPEIKEFVPAMPQAYELAASRFFNRFIKDTTQVYAAKPNVLLYLKPTEIVDADLPDGAKQANATIKNRLLPSFTYALTDDETNNDYSLHSKVEWFDTPSKTVPAIKYTVTLFDKNNKQMGQWVEIVKKAENSQKWL